jgi:cobalt-zinc-cadmium efflux system outer membrane protein
LLPTTLAIIGSLIQIQTPILSATQAQPLTQEEAVRTALERNPRIRALAYDIQSAERGVAGARAFANPEVTFAPGFTRTGSDEELRISQPLEINGLRSARIGVAQAKERLSRASALSELREFVFTVKKAHTLAARAKDRLALAEDVARSTQELHRVAQRQVELGNRPGVERSQANIEGLRAAQQATLAKAEYESAQAALGTLLAKPAGEPFAVAQLGYIAIPSPGAEELTNQALLNRSEVAASLAARDAHRQEAKLARAEGMPDIAPHFRADSITRSPNNSGFGVTISIPLIDYGSRRNRIAQAETAAKAEEQRHLAVQHNVRLEVAQAISRLQAADEVVKSFQGGMLDEALKLRDATLAGFSLGQGTLTTVLEAQRTYRAVQSEYIEALASYNDAVAQLEFATGAVPATVLDQVKAREEKRG